MITYHKIFASIKICQVVRILVTNESIVVEILLVSVVELPETACQSQTTNVDRKAIRDFAISLPQEWKDSSRIILFGPPSERR